MARTFTPITGSGGGGAFVNGGKWGYQEAERVRQALDMALYLAGHLDLGGDERAILSGSYVPVNGARSFELNGDNFGGLAVEAVIFTYTQNAGTQVTARVRNTTDSSNAGASTPSTSTSVVREVVTLTLASGLKEYQLQVTGSNTNAGVFAWGYLRLVKVPS